MIKVWEIGVQGQWTHKTIFGKEITENGHCFPWKVEASSKEEAIEKAKQRYKESNIDNVWGNQAPIIKYCKSWDDWTVERALKSLTGKQFAEYAKQQGLQNIILK